MRFKIKNTMILATLLAKPLDRRLIMVILWWMQRFGEMTVTEGWRISMHKNDLHGLTPLRAIDVRSRNLSYPQLQADKVNKVWQYDPERPDMVVCLYHKNHFHVQVCDNTKMRED